MNAEAHNPISLSPEYELLQRELTQARAELEEFTYSVSHDLRASLRHVTAYVQIIQEDLAGQVNAEIMGHLGTVSTAAQTMSRQIDALGALSRLGRVEMQLAPINLNDLVTEVMDDMAPAPQAGPLAWHVAADVPMLLGDATLIHQVLTELLSNAIKFSKQGSQATVGLSWTLSDHGRCVVTVSDNGVGFNPQYKSKLFHAFQRLHSSRDFEGMGMGMGLAKCRKIIERHGGEVWAEGKVDGGCLVSFTLPLASAQR
ncbi:ATP-binding protein [Rhodoferax sp. PAMC 29310]|uniref:sensor histidine kinase n=1 Tax=Rhodoferax sp. PAMC 29310 TaxID=2822760 RepID=UPI001B33DD17|nr:ATP-binding protein [Rhodoferax sp. PAMC 29310]